MSLKIGPITPVKGALIALCVGLLITALSIYEAGQANERAINTSVDRLKEQALQRISSRVNLYQYGLRGARGAIVSVGTDAVTIDSFRRYSQTRDVNDEFPGALGFGFIRRVAPENVNSYVAKMRQSVAPDFSIRQLSPSSGERFVIQFIEPVQPNKEAVGLDIASEANRRNAAITAMRSGRVSLTAPITLVQAEKVPRQGFLILMPIYDTIVVPPDMASREAHLIGWSYAPLIAGDVLGNLDLPEGIQLSLIDVTESQQSAPFFSTELKDGVGPLVISSAIENAEFGRVWEISLGIHQLFVDNAQPFSLVEVAVDGGVGSVVLSILTFAWLNGRKRKLEILSAQADLAAIVESSIDGIIGTRLDGTVTSWNKGAEIIFGFPADEAKGRKVADLVVPADRQQEESMILSTISHGKHLDAFDSKRRTKDGNVIDVSISVSPIRGLDGRITGVSKTLRDISKQKRLESELKELNVNLESEVELRTRELEVAQRTLRAVLDAVPSMIGYWDKNLINRVANHAYGKWFDVNPADLPGKSLRDLLGPELFEANRPHIEAALRGEAQTFERTVSLSDGGVRHSLAYYLPDMIDGEVEGFYVIVHDVSELAESKAQLTIALRQNEQLLAAINEQLLYSVADEQGCILEANDYFCEAHGYKREELIGENHRILNSGEHKRQFWTSMWKTLRQGNAWRGEICNHTARQESRWFDTVITPIRNEQGKIERYLALRIDITERKQTESEIHRLHLLLTNVLRSASEISIIATDTQGVITLFNRGAQRMLGYDEDEMVGLNTPALIHLPEEIEKRSSELGKIYRTSIEGFRVFVHKSERDGAETRDWTYVRKDGGHLTVSLTVTPMLDDGNRIEGYLGIAIDVTDQKKQQNALAAAKEQMDLAADVAQLGVWSWNFSDNSIEWSDQMYRIYEQPLSLRDYGLRYEHWRERVHPDDIEYAEESLNAAINGMAVYDPVFRICLPDGRIRFIKALGRVLNDNDGKPVRVVGINLDITEQRLLEQSLIEAKESSDAANTAKTNFLANMSHEIRTPMNAVLGMLQLLLQTPLDARQHDYASKTQSAAKSLLGLLNDILDFSKIEAGKLQLDLHPFELDGLLQDIAVVVSGSTGEKNVEVMFDVDAALPQTIVGDRLRLQQILFNLVSNAVKFTEKGEVVVRLEALGVADSKVQLRIEVRDTGIGISEDQRERIFEGFTQAEASTARRYGGTGLGLVITRHLVSMMGGELNLASTPGEGSSFWFDLSLDMDSDYSDVPGLPDDLSGIRVLVVDDNLVSGEIMSKTIESLGGVALYVQSGQQAIYALADSERRGEKVEVVLLDWCMPGMNGAKTAEAISQSTEISIKPPIVVVTAHARDELADRVNHGETAFSDYLTKPLTPKQLSDALNRTLMGDPVREKATAGLEPGDRLAGLRILVVEDNPLNREVAHGLLSGEGADVTLANGGLEGVAKVEQTTPLFDVVVMDVQMPDIDGLEATRRIRSNRTFQDLYIVAMTANASLSDKEACLEAGMNAYVSKPFDIDTAIPVLLGRQPSAERFDRQLEKSEASSAEMPLVEPVEARMRRFGNNLNVYRQVMNHFEAECVSLHADLISAVNSERLVEVKCILHSLKGVSANVGASALAAQASEWETRLKNTEEQRITEVLSEDELASLHRLILNTVERLPEGVSALPHSSTDAGQTMAADEILRVLQDLLPMLEAHSIDAVDVAEDLILRCPPSELSRVQPVVDYIQRLQFSEAIQLIRGNLGP